MFGERGILYIVVQKTCIQIARALVWYSKILFLSESTAELSTESILIVQEALEHAVRGKTTWTFEHRVSKVWNTTPLLRIQNGYVKERGTHDTWWSQNLALTIMATFHMMPLYRGIIDIRNYSTSVVSPTGTADLETRPCYSTPPSGLYITRLPLKVWSSPHHNTSAYIYRLSSTKMISHWWTWHNSAFSYTTQTCFTIKTGGHSCNKKEGNTTKDEAVRQS